MMEMSSPMSWAVALLEPPLLAASRSPAAVFSKFHAPRRFADAVVAGAVASASAA